MDVLCAQDGVAAKLELLDVSGEVIAYPHLLPHLLYLLFMYAPEVTLIIFSQREEGWIELDVSRSVHTVIDG